MVADRYRIDSVLGEGGMGIVYAAEHTLMRKRVALKVLHPEMSRVPDIVARFEREALAAGHIDHPNVAVATDFGKLADGSFYLVLELIVGENLQEVVARGPLSVERSLHIATQITSALSRAHGLGVVHRDLKPDNVMLVTRGDDLDFVKILDFGIAKVPVLEAESNVDSIPHPSPKMLTKAGMVYGTPAYMSPEQALGQPVDGRADLYALGVLLYEMLTGKRPFEHDNMATLLGLHVAAPVPPMVERAPGVSVPIAIEEVVRKLMAKDPAMRFATAAEVGLALAEAGGVPLPPEPSLQRTARISAARISGASAAVPASSIPGAEPQGRRRMVLTAVVLLALFVLGAVAAMAIARSHRAVAVVGDAAVYAPAAPSASVAVVDRAAHPVPSDPNDVVTRAVAAADAALSKGDFATALRTLAPLEAEHGSRPELHRVLEHAYALKQDRVSALREAAAWLAVDAAANRDLTLQRDIGTIATIPAMSEAAIGILASKMGAPGVDILYDLAFASKQAPTVTSQAEAALGRPDVRARAGPAAAILLDLRAAKTCKDRRALLARVISDADNRALAILQPWTAIRCMRGDGDLKNAIDAVRGRSGML